MTDAEPQLLDQGLGDFLGDVASAAPAPGGGVVAAVTVAAAAGLVAMASRCSRDLAGAAETFDEADTLRAQAMVLAARDGPSYAAVLAATDDAQRRGALAAATEVPRDVVRLAARVAELADRVAGHGNPNLEGDAVTGLLLADAAARSAGYLVQLNGQAGSLGPDLTDEVRRRCEEVAATAARWTEPKD